MANLRPSTGSASSLLRSANSLATQNQSYEDSVQSYIFSQSAYTDDAFQHYSDYLTGRINTLSSAGGLSNIQKALTLTRTLDSANRSNTSASLVRENIQIMAGNATLQNKYDLVRDLFVRAAGNGDMTLAQSLMSQAYSIDQTIQLQAQQARDAAGALGRASAAAAKSAQQDDVNKQTDIIKNLDDGLETLNSSSKLKSQADFTKFAGEFVKANADTYSELGVTFAKSDGSPNVTPSYFDIVKGTAVAKYNAMVLKAQAEAAINPQTASQWAHDANQFANYGTVSTLAGRLTLQQIQEAAQSPNMLVYDNSTGTYKQSTKTGFQYQNFKGYKVVNGETQSYDYKALVPTYSGYASGEQASKVYFLTPNQTALMGSLGLQIEATVNRNGTVGTGIKAQASGSTPGWLTKIVGKGGEDQFFNQDGQLSFSSGGKFYTLSQDGKGLIGVTMHNEDGSTQIVGGNYGYNPSPVSKGGNGLHGSNDSITNLKGPHMDLKSDFSGINQLISAAQVRQKAVEAATAAANAKAAAEMLRMTPAPLPNISIAPSAAPPPLQQAPSPALPAITWNNPSPSVAQAPKVASPAKSPQNPGSIPLQGGGVKLQ